MRRNTYKCKRKAKYVCVTLEKASVTQLRYIHDTAYASYEKGTHIPPIDIIEANNRNKGWWKTNIYNKRPVSTIENLQYIYFMVTKDKKYMYVGKSKCPIARWNEHNNGCGSKNTNGKEWVLVKCIPVFSVDPELSVSEDDERQLGSIIVLTVERMFQSNVAATRAIIEDAIGQPFDTNVKLLEEKESSLRLCDQGLENEYAYQMS